LQVGEVPFVEQDKFWKNIAISLTKQTKKTRIFKKLKLSDQK
jgi:hypothetical protein